MSSVAQRLLAGEEDCVVMTAASSPPKGTTSVSAQLETVMKRLDGIDAAIAKCALLADYCNNIVHIDKLQKDIAMVNNECKKRKAENDALMARVIKLEYGLDEVGHDAQMRLFTVEHRLDAVLKSNKAARIQLQQVAVHPAPPAAPASTAATTYTPLAFGDSSTSSSGAGPGGVH
jgi:hypothetical protein